MKPASVIPAAHISLIDLNKVSDDALGPYLDWLTPQELLRYQRFQRVLRRRQFLAGRVLLRWSVMQLMGVSLHSINLTERPQRAPLLHVSGVPLPPEFSLSHTGNWVGCACSTTTALGLDIEMQNPQRNLQAIAAHSFLDDEVRWMQCQPDVVEAFYFLWSCREARYKLTQNYVCAGVENCYAMPQAGMSMVLMTAAALAAQPDCTELDWHQIKR